jgi:hypothetical protein
MFDLSRVATHDNLRVLIYEDRPSVPPWFKDRFPGLARLLGNDSVVTKLVRDYTTNLNWRDPVSLLAVLMEQTRFDHIRGRESDLARFSMTVWVPEEYGQPYCEPLLRKWRWTPQLSETRAGTVAA